MWASVCYHQRKQKDKTWIEGGEGHTFLFLLLLFKF